MMYRRQLLRNGAILGGGLFTAGCVSTHSSVAQSNTGESLQAVNRAQTMITPGIQLYTLRKALNEAPAKVMVELGRIGYEQVELAGLPQGVAAADFRLMLDDNGLQCPAMHVQGSIASQVDIARSLGAHLLVLPVPMPLLNEKWQLRADATLDDFRHFASTLNAMGAEAKQYGLQFGFHNHAWEMAVMEGKLAYEILLEETDPELVFMELDLGWAHVGRANANSLINSHPGRFKTCHVKDFNEAGDMVNAGEGVVPLAEQLALRDMAGLQHYFIEHDDTKDALESAQLGYEFLTAL